MEDEKEDRGESLRTQKTAPLLASAALVAFTADYLAPLPPVTFGQRLVFSQINLLESVQTIHAMNPYRADPSHPRNLTMKVSYHRHQRRANRPSGARSQLESHPVYGISNGPSHPEEHIETFLLRKNVPYPRIQRPTVSMPAGQIKVIQKGRPGQKITSLKIVYLSGKRIATRETVHVIPAIPEITLVGQKQTRIKSVTTNVPTARSLTSRSETPLEHSEAISVLATAYVAGGTTATGVPAEPGVIAVDPSVIPLGSRVYVPGFGTLVAADTGGDIVGDRIDICVSTYTEAIDFGRRDLTIYVLQSS